MPLRLKESKCCFDRRVWIGLGVLAVGLLVADPRAGWVALPVLAGLACPVSMLLMMRSMRRPAGGAKRDRDAEIARLRREIEQLKASGGDMAHTAAAAAAQVIGKVATPHEASARPGAWDDLRPGGAR